MGTFLTILQDFVDFVMKNADHGFVIIKKDKIKEVMKQKSTLSL